MRSVVCLALAALLGCGGPAKPVVAPSTQLSAEQERAQWAAIAELARPSHSGPSDALARAVEAADVGALVAWARQSGGLLPPQHVGETRHAVTLLAVGRRAIEAATDADWEPLGAAGYLGLLLVQDGGSLLDATVGVTLLEQAATKARELGDPKNSLELPNTTDLVHVVAAEAVFSREMVDAARTPEGRKAHAELGIPYDDEALLALVAFWPLALADARLNESSETTLARLQSAAAAPAAVKARDFTEPILRQMREIDRSLQALHTP